MRRPFIDYVHRATVLSILGLAGWGLWLTGAVYVSRIGNTDRYPYGGRNRDTMTEVVGRIVERWKEVSEKKAQEKIAAERSSTS
ncbi:hypothetical protein DNF11_1337 [Malassezia restricta CBS 7877]|uniref:Uncharacterized protein n=1 Tax=Malassezia restricta (strain ATCC 96810 / NBRC 103918 / CBS 7877) TaxID=425264 RepID=A0A3G2S8B1_MALR7|nr:hypothetical protein DNF11_1337 [Malassezia restricta CBS 7877]